MPIIGYCDDTAMIDRIAPAFEVLLIDDGIIYRRRSLCLISASCQSCKLYNKLCLLLEFNHILNIQDFDPLSHQHLKNTNQHIENKTSQSHYFFEIRQDVGTIGQHYQSSYCRNRHIRPGINPDGIYHMEARKNGHGLLADRAVVFRHAPGRGYLSNRQPRAARTAQSGFDHDDFRKHSLPFAWIDWRCI